ncbi:MAG TPA: CpaF/VirB11 family protein [Candidatus Dormibacteraeota bacterium]|jgi:Flp pilus assembly CpaF family ATPase|nr:CpaF/VirB11 family protein [Candidatus Dormibacteraeota bacterium]
MPPTTDMAAGELRHTPLPVSAEVPVSRWPQIASEELEVAQAIADAVIRGRGGEPASVLHEERLHGDVAAVIERAIASPSSSGLPLAVVSELSANRGYRDVARRNAAILASHLWPLSLLIYGADLENITCLGHDHWLVSMVGRKLSLVGNSPFASDEECIEFFRRAVRLRGVTGDHSITEAAPIAEANIGSVARLCVAKRPAVSGQAALKAAIRIPARSKVRDLDDYVHGAVMPEGMARFLGACVAARVNLMIAGGTSTGKTTLMRVLCGMVPPSEHLVVVEDGAELHLDQDRGDGHPWHTLTSALSTIPSVRAEVETGQLTMFDLVRHALRFQPDRLILGESRGEEMAAVCKALMTGHDGSMTTIHAEDAELALDQAVQYVLENRRFTGNEKMAKRVVEHAIHMVLHLANQDGRRRVTGILAVERGGNHKWVYRQTDGGGWRRMTELTGNLSRLGSRLRAHLDGDEVPVP